MGDYKKLAAMGYDVSYLKRMQDAELEQLALDAMLTRANIAKVNSSVTRGRGGGTRSGKKEAATAAAATAAAVVAEQGKGQRMSVQQA